MLRAARNTPARRASHRRSGRNMTASLRAAPTNPARRAGHRNEQTKLFKL
ncbi:hypothetical protein A2U01_0082117, partial [Trifolium medium]|nr:hypothetical protein [Trifolium medium]